MFRSEDLLQLLLNRKTLPCHISSQNLVAVLEDLFDADRSDEWNNLMEVLMVSTPSISCPAAMLFYNLVHLKLCH